MINFHSIKNLLLTPLLLITCCSLNNKTNSSSNSFVVTIDNYSFKMIYLKGGSYSYGISKNKSFNVSPFYIGETEVTQELWMKIMEYNPSFFEGDSLPVESVSWNECQDFIEKLNEKTGLEFRLPNELEWEYAANGTNKKENRPYAGNANIDEIAWYCMNSGDKEIIESQWSKDILFENNCSTHKIGTKKSNRWGLYDMCGNVCEWCNDWYSSDFSHTKGKYQSPLTGTLKVYKGGSWCHTEEYLHTDYRHGNFPENRRNCIGLRLALNKKQ